MSKSKWKVTSNLIGDMPKYRVFRLKDITAVDHSGNREYAMDEHIKNCAIADAVALRLNNPDDTNIPWTAGLTLNEQQTVTIYVHDYKCHGAWM
jgi:hypothetical protein